MLDQIDRNILRELCDDGRLSWVELAERVNLSATACQRRVQGLLDEGIIDGISARIDPEAGIPPGPINTVVLKTASG